MPTVAPNGLIVVTGITGYVASHVGLEALKAGYRVRGTVRSLGRTEEVKQAYAKQGADVSKLEFAELDDLTSEAQFAKVIKGAEGVAHVAIPGSVPGDSDENPKQAVESTLALLRAAAKEPSIKRVVLTSSSVAVISPPNFKEEPLTDKDWNDFGQQKWDNATEEDKKKPDWPMWRYAASKILSEKAAWKWVEENKPSFDIVTILPNANFGPVLFGSPRSTVGWIWTILNGDGTWTQQVPPQWFIDVRDDGRLHVLALTDPSLAGKRIWAAAEPYGWNKIIHILRKEFPKAQLPPEVPGAQGEPDRQKIDNSVATKALGGWISLEKSLVDTAKSLGF
ncbi:NAD P-binding protein [Gloeophyllum trabeum ATCC 11539]|uniref:NAD P-binding protein n=1 Tax=Gloeophyllum trabeum (strain ATCC 11539 / FP-39264 / Madison 617) TaxID=670483 RepID=S7RYZ1_GLOTA|nr:NAD P-binding protein [Gloeophyllum trabeum ATCC 11539]EPQ60190.1 NAD P-binding protein [Gloeophyllum trabeum ATCC 11539]